MLVLFSEQGEILPLTRVIRMQKAEYQGRGTSSGIKVEETLLLLSLDMCSY